MKRILFVTCFFLACISIIFLTGCNQDEHVSENDDAEILKSYESTEIDSGIAEEKSTVFPVISKSMAEFASAAECDTEYIGDYSASGTWNDNIDYFKQNIMSYCGLNYPDNMKYTYYYTPNARTYYSLMHSGGLIIENKSEVVGVILPITINMTVGEYFDELSGVDIDTIMPMFQPEYVNGEMLCFEMDEYYFFVADVYYNKDDLDNKNSNWKDASSIGYSLLIRKNVFHMSDNTAFDTSQTIPFASVKCESLEKSFDEVRKEYGLWLIEVDNGQVSYMVDTAEEHGATYYRYEDNCYYGIKDNTVVVDIVYTGMTVARNVLPAELLDVEPYIVEEGINNGRRLYWKVDNGYIVVFTTALTETDWRKIPTVYCLMTSDLVYCPVERNNILTAVKKWDYSEYAPIPFRIEELRSSSRDINWYDNGIFSSFMEKEYPGDTWDYVSTFNCDMEVNPYGYTGFQIYSRHSAEDFRDYAYLVPVSPAGAPEVYVLDDDLNNMKIVFCGIQ